MLGPLCLLRCAAMSVRSARASTKLLGACGRAQRAAWKVGETLGWVASTHPWLVPLQVKCETLIRAVVVGVCVCVVEGLSCVQVGPRRSECAMQASPLATGDSRPVYQVCVHAGYNWQHGRGEEALC